MGVDYTANYGFGVKVIGILNQDSNNILDDLDDLLENSPYCYFEVGNSYSGEDVDIYIVNHNVIDDLDKDNGYYCIQSYAEEMKLFLESKGIEFEGVPNIIGGLRIH